MGYAMNGLKAFVMVSVLLLGGVLGGAPAKQASSDAGSPINDILVPTREPLKEETATYGKALLAWKNGKDSKRIEPLLVFLEKDPKSPWAASALMAIGLAYKDAGNAKDARVAFDGAVKLYEEAARMGRKRAQQIADWAFVESVELQAEKGDKNAFKLVANRMSGREMLSAQTSSVGGRQFEYDAENRLVSVTLGTHRTEFGYDGFGRCVEIKELDKDAQGNIQISSDKKYLWVGLEMAQERDATGGVVLKQFFRQGFVDSDGTNLYYTRDHLGSIRELTDSKQVVRARYDYDPYGRMTKISGDKDTVFGYTGHMWHAQSGLNLTLFRAYDPNFGRWISRDPIGMADGTNLYAYVRNNPINSVDKFGLDTCTCDRINRRWSHKATTPGTPDI